MVWAQNPDGTTATAAYATIAGAERPLEVRDELGTPTTFEYDDRANCTAVVNALGQRAETTFDSRGRPVTRRDPAGAVTTMVWNDRSNLVAVRDALGNERSSSFDILGNETSSSDARGNQTQRQFDDLRRVVAETLPADASGQQATVRYVYDGEGRVIRSVDAKGHETVFTYDGYGRLVTTTDALGHVTTNTWDEAGRLVETKDARGNVTRFAHDALDRVVRTVDALGNAAESDFDAAGRTVATRDAAGNETSFVFDARDRVVEVHGPDGAVTSFEYDAAGRRTAMVDPVGRRTEYEHDLLGRVVVQRRFLDGAPLETLSEFDEQGNRTAVTDEAGRTTRFRFDLLGRLTETEDPAGGVTRRDYDADSNMVRYVNAKGSAWEFDYDALSRVVAERDPLGHESLFRYDLNGNLVWKRDPKGQETVLAYDALNRLTRVDYADGQWAAFSFDQNGNRTQIEGSDGQRVAQTFDELDRVRTITHSALDRQLSYEYTATGARSAFETRDLTSGLVERTSYEWDQAGRPVAIRPPTGDVVAYRYAPDGAREGATLPNGVDVGYQYDSLGRLVEMTYRDPSSREIAFFRYTYSTAGNRTSQVDTEGLTQYTYGALDRLVEARYPDGSFEKFTWDQVGNRLTHEDPDGVTSYAYDAGDRLLATTGAKPSSFTWDPNGNMLSKTDPEGTVAYRWNVRDRLVRVDLPDGASNLYRYLPESDLRFSVTDKTGAETRFLWDGSNVVEELGPSNLRLAAYIEGLGVDEHLARVGADGAVHAYVAEPLGTVRALVDSSGQIQNAYAYKAFGDVRAAVEGIPNPYRFTGRSFEPDTGEYYYRARYYQPGLGRFGAVDRYAPDEETYAYVRGNPLGFSDPDGTFVWVPFLLKAAAVIGAGISAWNLSDYYMTLQLASAAKANFRDRIEIDESSTWGGLAQEINYSWVRDDGSKQVIAQAGANALDVLTLMCPPVPFGPKAISPWSYGNFARGHAIEKLLGQNLPQAFPVIDIFEESTGVATSIKSMDLGAKTYQTGGRILSRGMDWVRKLADFRGASFAKRTVGNPLKKVLLVAIPEGALSAAQAGALDELVDAATTLGVAVVVKKVK